MKVGLIGCGNIGSVIAKAFDSGRIDGSLVSVYDIDISKAQNLVSNLKSKPRIVKSINGLLRGTDIIVEAASQDAVRDYALKVLSDRKSILIMSVGALLNEKLFGRMVSLAMKNNVRIYIPSGAICGVDGVKSAALGSIKRVLLQTTKPPKSIKGFEHVRRRRVVFDGPAAQAVKLFPVNVNVSAVLSLAGVGAGKTRVRLIADPSVKRNIHEVFVSSRSGNLYSRVENIPAPDNPKTSYLACLSAIRTLRDIGCAVRVGT